MTGTNEGGLSRRSVLRGAAYAVPAVTVLSLSVGAAEAASSGVANNNTAQGGQGGTGAGQGGVGDLPFTGSPVVPLAALAAGTVAAGVGLERAARKRAEGDPAAS